MIFRQSSLLSLLRLCRRLLFFYWCWHFKLFRVLTELDMSSPKGVNCWENFRHKKTYFVLHKCALYKQINRVWKLNGLPLNLVLRLPRYQPKKNGKLICELCRGFTSVARFDMQLIHLKKHCPFGIDLPHLVYNKI